MLVDPQDEKPEASPPSPPPPTAHSHLRVRADLYEEYSSDEIAKMTELYEGTLSNIEEGEIVKSKVLRVTDTAVILDVGFKSEGAVPIDEQLGLGTGALSPGLERVACRLGISDSFAEAADCLHETLRVELVGEAVRRDTERIGAVARSQGWTGCGVGAEGSRGQRDRAQDAGDGPTELLRRFRERRVVLVSGLRRSVPTRLGDGVG